ncbi:MAG TPA: MtrB/PioB family outer membrane beta-barrel protein [Thermoanaerobaculia bacterium]
MRIQHLRRKLFPLAAGLILLAGSGAAVAQEQGQEDQTTTQEEQTSTDTRKEFTFRVDPVVLGIWEADVDTDSAKWEEYRDVSSGFVPFLNIEGEAGDRFMNFRGEHIRRDDARYNFSYGILDRYSIVVDYNKIPHRFGNNGHMLWTRTGPGRLEITDPIQAANQTTLVNQFAVNPSAINFTFLNNLLRPYLATAQEIDLGLIRDRTLARVDLGSMAGFAWGLEYTHENRKGDRAYGGSFGFNNVTEVPEPIDYDTTGAQIAGEWNTQRGGLRLGYRYSEFENNISTLMWDNPFRVTNSTDASAYQAPGSASVNGSVIGVADLAASNEASLLFFDGRTRLGGWNLSGNLGYQIMTQDDPLLAYTPNTAIQGIGFDHQRFNASDPATLPVRSADREVQTLSLNAQAGTRFGERWDLTFRYRFYDYDDQSDRIEFPGYARYQAVWEEIPRITVPYAWTRQNASAELGFEITNATRLGFAYILESWDREFREIESSDEDILRLTFDTQPSNWFSLRASYEYGDRSIGDYHTDAQEFSFVEPEGINNLPGLRKYDEAARTSDTFNVLAQLFPTEAWSFSLGATGRDEEYDESEFGLVSDDTITYNAELSYTPGENLTFFLFGQRQDRESFQRNRQSGGTLSTNPLDDWQVLLDETTDLWGLGMTSRFNESWSAELEGRWSKSDGFADFFSPPGGTPNVAVDFDNYEDIELLSLLGRLDYKITRNARAGLFYRWEDYTIDSFIFQGLQNYLPGALLLNPNFQDYTGSILGFELSLSVD